VLNYVKDGGGTLYLSKDNGGGLGWMTTGDGFTVNQGILKLDHRARGNSAMQLVVKDGATLQIVGEEAIPSGSVSLAGNGIYGTNGALEFVGGLNTSGAGTNRIETATVILTTNASIGVTESGQLNKCGLSGAFRMTKVGAGELELGSTLYTTNAAPWAGIIVSNGTLKVSGNITYSTPITVATGAVLRVTATFGSVGGAVSVQTGGKVEGTGTVNGAVTVDGELAPGVGSAIPGALTINNSLTLNAGSTTTVQVAAASNDQVAGLTSVVFGGTLNVTDISLGGITPGQTFQLFSMGGSGSFTITGTPSIGGTWSFNPATGVLSHVP
jgi:fibronectin-binding autotransporter adhesin